MNGQTKLFMKAKDESVVRMGNTGDLAPANSEEGRVTLCAEAQLELFPNMLSHS